jgi:SAM-dependent methyltransferase
MWDERYNQPDYVYGKKPNDFLAEMLDKLPRGKALALADGEGRNGVFLAENGFQVTSVDSSAVGLSKAAKLATEKGVYLETIVRDLAQFKIEPDSWVLIMSIYCHLPPPLRKQIHRDSVQGLRPGGVFLLEAYTPRQLQFKTGGPSMPELLMELAILKEELMGLDFVHGAELVRPVREGALHSGMGAVVQILAIKP